MTTKQKTPDVNFSGLILGFSSAALYYLGHTSVDGKDSVKVNPTLALQNIQIIELLQTKTLGNLSVEEKKLIEDILLDLKAKFSKSTNS
jgi:hypothetical protein